MNPYSEFIASQQELLLATMRDILRGARRCALLDFPNHNNVGDNAIWLGELACLGALEIDANYQCDLASYDREALARAVPPGGTILLHGGGNLGDVWPAHQRFRERVIADFPDRRIVQLPQSGHFSSPRAIEAAAAVMGAHRDFILLCRDQETVALGRDGLGVDARLCPDMAFMLGEQTRPAKAVVDILWIARTDHETDARPIPIVDGIRIEVTDWLVGEPGRRLSPYLAKLTVRSRRAAQGALRRSATVRRAFRPTAGIVFEQLASRRLHRGLRILSRGRVVVTDRLHGHILATLLGLPQLLRDNHYGKIARYRAAFANPSRYAMWVESVTGDDLHALLSIREDAL